MEKACHILLWDLPPALDNALREQFAGMEDLSPAARDDEDPVDLIVLGANAPLPGDLPATPHLRLAWAQPLRLGRILRQIRQICRQPGLYLEDFTIGPYLFSPAERKLSAGGGSDVALTDRECDILAYLARFRGQAVSRDALLRNVWRYQDGIDTHTLETHIYRLRQKMEISTDDPKILLTTVGGYRLDMT